MVSLLFGDLVGFTPIAESKDPEAVREMLSSYFERARAVVERYGGVVEKFIGDAVFAVWGVPAAREDDAERAVRAGLDMASAVTALGEELDDLQDLVNLLELVPAGQRYRLADGALQRAKAHLSGAPVDGLRAAIAIFDQMGAAYWAARVRVELAAALDAAGEPGAAAALDAAEPVLITAQANRALREAAQLRDRLAAEVLSS